MVREISTSSGQLYPTDTNRPRASIAAESGGAAREGNRTESGGDDELVLSPQASMAETLAKWPFWQLLGIDSESGNLSIREAYDRQFPKFVQEISSRLEEAGVDTSQEFSLQSDARGRIVVAGDHPDKDTIEQVFEDDPDLANRFRGFSATASLLHAAEEAIPFHEAYAQDPYAAVQRFSHLFDQTRQSLFTLHFGPDGAEEVFRTD